MKIGKTHIRKATISGIEYSEKKIKRMYNHQSPYVPIVNVYFDGQCLEFEVNSENLAGFLEIEEYLKDK